MTPPDSHPPAETDASGDESPPPGNAARRPRRKRRRRPRSGDRDGSEPRKPASTTPAPPAEVARLKDIERRTGDLPAVQAGIIRRRLSGARRLLDEGRSAARPLAAIERDLTRMLDARAARLGRPLEVTYPAELPVSLAREEIAAAIRDHQVVVVCGETGSGKTTQLPKICLELGRGVDGLIGHTQPRRVAARSVAARIAEELETPLGEGVGYAVRFNDRTRPGTRVKLMTDGILLAETQRDRDLVAYDTLIIDEAHERSLNIDFLLGYLKRLLSRRPDLKVVITSATIDPERFSRHFGNAPIVQVGGRMHPVEIRHRPIATDGADQDVDEATVAGVLDAITEIDASGIDLASLGGESDDVVSNVGVVFALSDAKDFSKVFIDGAKAVDFGQTVDSQRVELTVGVHVVEIRGFDDSRWFRGKLTVGAGQDISFQYNQNDGVNVSGDEVEWEAY